MKINRDSVTSETHLGFEFKPIWYSDDIYLTPFSLYLKFILLKLILNATSLNSLEGFLSVSLSFKLLKICVPDRNRNIFCCCSYVYKAGDCLKTYTCQQFVRKLRQREFPKKNVRGGKNNYHQTTSLIRGSLSLWIFSPTHKLLLFVGCFMFVRLTINYVYFNAPKAFGRHS